MGSSLSNTANNLAGGIHKIKYKYKHVKFVELNTKIASAFLNTQVYIEYKCLYFNKNC